MHAVPCRHGRVALVGHSAGGWLARILLGEEPYQGAFVRCVCAVRAVQVLGCTKAVTAWPVHLH